MALYQITYTQVVNGKPLPGSTGVQLNANSEKEAKEKFLHGKDSSKYKILGVIKR